MLNFKVLGIVQKVGTRNILMQAFVAVTRNIIVFEEVRATEALF